jgi:hypothetical protein
MASIIAASLIELVKPITLIVLFIYLFR